jgi:peptidyl-prolyl cis-trans isomerase C
MTIRSRSLALAILGAAWAFPLAAQDASTVVATVNGTEITLGHHGGPAVAIARPVSGAAR